jgi:nucleoside-diphosphate-sugar epimerase
MDFQTGDPSQSIPQNIQGALNALEAAKKEPAVKRVVFTSSSWAVITPSPDVPYTVDEKTFNEDAIAAARAPPPYDASRAMTVYSAAKAQAEQACWKWMGENDPDFTLNV